MFAQQRNRTDTLTWVSVTYLRALFQTRRATDREDRETDARGRRNRAQASKIQIELLGVLAALLCFLHLLAVALNLRGYSAARREDRRQNSSIGGSSSAICEPTIAKTSASRPIGSGMSAGSPVASHGRRAARSPTLRAFASALSRAASVSVKVLLRRRGARSRTASRCALVMVRTRSAPAAIRGVNCRAEKFDGLPPRSCRTRAASWWIGCATTARVPALDVLNAGI